MRAQHMKRCKGGKTKQMRYMYSNANGGGGSRKVGESITQLGKWTLGKLKINLTSPIQIKSILTNTAYSNATQNKTHSSILEIAWRLRDLQIQTGTSLVLTSNGRHHSPYRPHSCASQLIGTEMCSGQVR